MYTQRHLMFKSFTNSMKIINFVESYVYKKYNDSILKYFLVLIYLLPHFF